MNIYSLCMSYEIMEYETGYDFEYITNEKLYTKEEFISICEKCLSECKEKCNWELKRRLISDYGFKELKVVSQFDFYEDCE